MHGFDRLRLTDNGDRRYDISVFMRDCISSRAPGTARDLLLRA
jgi:hypothetical protein